METWPDADFATDFLCGRPGASKSRTNNWREQWKLPPKQVFGRWLFFSFTVPGEHIDYENGDGYVLCIVFARSPTKSRWDVELPLKSYLTFLHWWRRTSGWPTWHSSRHLLNSIINKLARDVQWTTLSLPLLKNVNLTIPCSRGLSTFTISFKPLRFHCTRGVCHVWHLRSILQNYWINKVRFLLLSSSRDNSSANDICV